MGALLECPECRRARKFRRQALKFDCLIKQCFWARFGGLLVCFCMFLGASWGFFGLLWGVLGATARADQHKNEVHDHCSSSASSSSSSSSSSSTSSSGLCCRRRRRVRRHRLLLYHIPQRHEAHKHGDSGSVDPRSGRVGGCPEGLTIKRQLRWKLNE